MIIFDIITLAVIGWMVFRGQRDGFVSQFLSLIGIALGATLAISYGEALGSGLGIGPQYAAISGFIIILVAMIAVTLVLTKILVKYISFAGLSWLNTLLGIVFAIIKGIAVLGLLYAAIFAVNERTHTVEPEKFNESVSFNLVRKAADPLLEYWEKTKPLEKLQNTEK